MVRTISYLEAEASYGKKQRDENYGSAQISFEALHVVVDPIGTSPQHSVSNKPTSSHPRWIRGHEGISGRDRRELRYKEGGESTKNRSAGEPDVGQGEQFLIERVERRRHDGITRE
ncbi:hypothetical protein KM043_007028 [Ampulex compressa]|nr:hypothetical protein KM043_007028 [Ampulex compressa]